MNNERSRLTDEYLNDCITILGTVIEACHDTKNTDKSFSRACRERGLDSLKVRAMLLTTLPNFSHIKEPDESVLSEIYDGYERFYHHTFGTENIQLPYDYKEAVDVVLAKLDEREEDVIRRHYGLQPYNDATLLGDIGSSLGLSRERVKQIALKAIRKTRRKECRDILKYGVEKYALIKQQEKEQQEAEIAVMNEEHKAHMQKLYDDYKKKVAIVSKETLEDMNDWKKDLRKELENTDVYSIGLTVRSANALYRSGIKNVYVLMLASTDLLKIIRNSGKKTVDDIMTVLNNWVPEYYNGMDVEDVKGILLMDAQSVDISVFLMKLKRIPVSSVCTNKWVTDKFISNHVTTAADLFRLSDKRIAKCLDSSAIWIPYVRVDRAVFAASYGMTEEMVVNIVKGRK